MPEDYIDPLDELDDTERLYQQVASYLDHNFKGKKRITKDTEFAVMVAWVNKCIKRFYWKNKPPEKVIYLCFRFLDSIDYPK